MASSAPVTPTNDNHTAATIATRPSMSSLSQCQNCATPCTLKCSRCASVYVCGRECQKSFWPLHKALCKRLAEPVRPGSGSPSEATTTRTCLIVDGMGPSGAGGAYVRGVQQEWANRGLTVATVNATKGGKIPEQIASHLSCCGSNHTQRPPHAMLLLGWGSGEGTIEYDFAESKVFRDAVVRWCRDAGGHLLVQGERVDVFGAWPSWFGMPWRSGTIARTSHVCRATMQRESADADATIASPLLQQHWCSEWYAKTPGAVTFGYNNVQACLLSHVDPQDALFATTVDSKSYSPAPGHGGRSIGAGQTAIAYGRVGRGTLSFFGDVGPTKETLQVMGIVAQGPREGMD